MCSAHRVGEIIPGGRGEISLIYRYETIAPGMALAGGLWMGQYYC